MAWWTNPGMVIKSKSRFLLKIGATTLFNVKSVSKPTVNVEKKEFRLTNHYYKYPGLVKWDPIEITMIDADGFNLKTDASDKLFLSKKSTGDSGDPTYSTFSPDNVYNVTNQGDKSIYRPNHKFHTYSWAAGEILNKLLSGGGYKNPDGTTVNNTLEKAAVIDAGFKGVGTQVSEIQILQLDPAGNTIESWTLENPIFTKLAWGSLDYSSDDPVEYTVTVEYDWATFSHSNQIN